MINRTETTTDKDGQRIRTITLEEVLRDDETERKGIPALRIVFELLKMTKEEQTRTKLDGMFYMRMKRYGRLKRVTLTTDLGSSGNTA
jgi:hypothetical protein